MANKHIHKLRRHRYKTGNEVYFCVLDCSFKVNPAIAIGKKSVCWRCGETFQMNEYSIRLAKPHCENCHRPKDKSTVQLPTTPTFTPTPDLRSRLAAALHRQSEELDDEI